MVRSFRKRFSQKAFTLVELLVSMSIMTLVMGITLMQRPEATIKLALADGVSSVELLIREAQLQGSAVNSVDNQFGGAGVFFSTSTSNKIIRFRDRVSDPDVDLGVGDGVYNVSGDINIPSIETAEVLDFKKGNKVKKLCVSDGLAALSCGSFKDITFNTLNVSFSRPSQKANIFVNGTDTNFTSGCIQIESLKAPNQGHIRSVYVYKSGVITKQIGPCS